ncbi:carbohydrate sulfotransferase 1-like [Neoarius graeffei]|uniref:carbohydrate sulfotransferase 1-like n=1 Tax=Neoarius graeffei TaxID=443677 RepID=UPI00298C984F|nr:carbohydrate sulfotransferase 1-like [Neoarius graeffei]
MQRNWSMMYLWRFVLLLCISLAVYYMSINPIQNFFPTFCQNANQCEKCPENAHSLKSSDNNFVSTKHTTAPAWKQIHLFSQARSGSSFAGQLFNQNPDIFYMFEPLYHAQQTFCNYTDCFSNALYKVLQLINREILFNIYTCNLNILENYIQPEPHNHLTDSFFRRSSSHALCSPPVCQLGNKEIMEEQPDENWCKEKCPILNLTLASMACQSRSHVSIKTVRIPHINDLRLLTQDPQLDLRIIHLVRDPRAILASRISAFTEQFSAWQIWNATDKQPHNMDLTQIKRTCQDMETSVDIGLKKPAWLQGRYLLVRYEDLAFNPEAKAKEIYKFLDLDIDNKVLTWLSRNTNDTSSTESVYSTSRNSKTTSESWRLHLGFDIVKTVQTLCNTTLDLLGYKTVQSEAELRNIELSLVLPRTFK